MTPTTKIVFHWTNKLGNKESLETIYSRFKNYAIELLEDEHNDLIKDIWCTIGNITTKLDYYNIYL